MAQKKDGNEAPTLPPAPPKARTIRQPENAKAAPARTPMAIAATRAAPSRIALRLTAVHSASGSESPWNGARPARSSPSVRSPSGAALIAKSVIQTTSSAVATSDTTPHRNGRRPAGVTSSNTPVGAIGVRSDHRRGERPPAAGEALERQIGDVEGVRAPVEHLLDDELRGGGRVHEPVNRETSRDVEAGNAGHRADDRVVVGSHLVIARPRVGDP